MTRFDSTNRAGTLETAGRRRCGGRGSLAVMVFLAAILAATASRGESIRIENDSPDTFHYSLRRQTAEWSGKTLELNPGQLHVYRESEPLVVSYWTDKARFATLRPGQTYRIDDAQGGELRPVPAARKDSSRAGAAEDPPAEPRAIASAKPRGDAPAEPERAPSSADAHLRVVRVLAVADSTYRRILSDWQGRIRTAVEGASELYESNFGIRFVVTAVQPLEYKGLNDKPDDRWNRLLRLSPGEADVLVAFIGFGDYYRNDEGAFYIGHLGQGMPFGQHVMVSGEAFIHPNRDRAVLIHELAHLFGAFHVQNDQSVMQRGYRDIPMQDIIQGKLHIDAPLREVVMLTRNVDFRRGVESLTPETKSRIQSLWRQYRHPAESESPDPIEMGYRYLGSRQEARNPTGERPHETGQGQPE